MNRRFVLTCCFVFAAARLVWAAEDADIPAKAPNDSIMASQAEVQAMLGWAKKFFLGTPSSGPENTFVGSATPFSFRYGGQASGELLKTWKRTVEFQNKDAVDRVQHQVTWADPKTGLQVTATIACFKEYPAVEWVLHFENQGKKDTPIIEDIQALDTTLRPSAVQVAVLHRILGDSCNDTSFLPIDTTLVAKHKITLAPIGGRPSRFTFPFFNLECAGAGVIVAVGWTGQWAASLEQATNGPVRIMGGMEKTHLVLHPGERIRTPRILMMSWKGDFLASQQRFRRLLMFHYAPKQNGRPPKLPMAIQCYDRYVWTRKEWATEAGQLAAAKAAHDCGCDALWLDAAWFIENDYAQWRPKRETFPNGLRPLADASHRLGLKFILWFQPEAGGYLDDPQARRSLTECLVKRVTEFDVDVFRNDFNIEPLGRWRAVDPANRQGITEIRYVEGLYTMWDELLARRPGLLIDNCASGGNRLDLETCMRSVPLWRSDTGCGTGHNDWNQAQTQGLSLYLPVFGACAWTPESYEARSAAAAGLACTFDYLDPKFPVDRAKAALAESKENQKYWYGDYYPLSRASTSNDQWAAYQFHRADLSAGIVMAFRRSQCPYPAITVKLGGIDPAKDYAVEFVDSARQKVQKTMSGRELSAEMDLKLPKQSSLMVRYRATSR